MYDTPSVREDRRFLKMFSVRFLSRFLFSFRPSVMGGRSFCVKKTQL